MGWRCRIPEALEIRDDLAFFQAIKARFAKFDDQTKTRTNEEIETAIRQIINDAIISSEVIDVFDAAGIKKPDISILSDEFLAEIQGMERKNLALELLKRLLNDEIKTRAKMNHGAGPEILRNAGRGRQALPERVD